MPFESFKSKNPEQLFEAFRKRIKRYTKNGLNNEVNQLITKFSRNNNISSEFKNENIQKAACAHEKTKDIIQRITDGINQQPRRERRGCCSHKVVAVGFNTLFYDARSVGVLKPPRE